MIITVTANPSLDRTVQVPRLARGDVLRATGHHVEPGGKGVNVSRALAVHGRKTLAVVCVGGADGQLLTELLDAEGVVVRAVELAGATRANISIAEPDGVVTKVNFPGPRLSEVETESLVRAVVTACEDGSDWIAGCGSLPPGMGQQSYARLVVRAHAAGARVAIDSSGAALRDCVSAGPDVIKPNRYELAECAATPVTTLGDAVRAANALRERGARTVLASLGRDGAVLVDAHGALHGEAPVAAARSTVGAGDATLAGFLAAGGAGREAFANALAWGAAATALPGSSMPSPADLEHIDVTIHSAIDDDRILTA
jgi:1-phosphofructokinase